MAIRPKFLDDESFFCDAKKDVYVGWYKVRENNVPSYLDPIKPQRESSANLVSMVVATAWSGGQIGDISPRGETYFVFWYQDHSHKENEKHFNKNVQVFTHDQDNKPIRFTFDTELDGHLVDSTATATTLPYLKEIYHIPSEKTGLIPSLSNSKKLRDPYPSETD